MRPLASGTEESTRCSLWTSAKDARRQFSRLTRVPLSTFRSISLKIDLSAAVIPRAPQSGTNRSPSPPHFGVGDHGIWPRGCSNQVLQTGVHRVPADTAQPYSFELRFQSWKGMP